MSDLAGFFRCPTHSAEQVSEIVCAARKLVDTIRTFFHEVWDDKPPFVAELFIANDLRLLLVLLRPPEVDSGIDWPLKLNTGIMALGQTLRNLANGWGWGYLLRPGGEKESVLRFSEWVLQVTPPMIRALELIPSSDSQAFVKASRQLISTLVPSSDDDAVFLRELEIELESASGDPPELPAIVWDLQNALARVSAPVLGNVRPLATEDKLDALTEAVDMIEAGMREMVPDADRAVTEAAQPERGQSAKRAPEFRRGELDERATAVLMGNPSLTNAQIAGIIGCNPASLKSSKLVNFKGARALLRKGRKKYGSTRGGRDKDDARDAG